MRILTPICVGGAMWAFVEAMKRLGALTLHLSVNPEQDRLVLIVSLIAMTICSAAVVAREAR